MPVVGEQFHDITKPMMTSNKWLETKFFILPLLILIYCGNTFFFYHAAILNGVQFDDSYITYRYASNLAKGAGFTFNSYEKVDSASSFGYTLFLSIFAKVGLTRLEFVSIIFGICSTIILIYLSFCIAFNILKNTFCAALLVLPLCLAGSISFWSISGMDSIFFAALITAFIYLYFRQASIIFISAVLAAVLLWRPEGILLLACVVLLEIVWPGAERLVKINNQGTVEIKRWALIVIIAIVPFAASMGFKQLYFGNIELHSFELKKYTHFYSDPLLDQLRNILQFLLKRYGTFFIGTLAAVLTVMNSRVERDRRLWFLAVYIVTSIISLVLGPFSESNRYAFHVIPLLMIGT